jgi:hypothetical protein
MERRASPTCSFAEVETGVGAVMLPRILSRLTYANVTATLALFIALGGTGYAALSLPRDSVGARELRSHSVGHSELGRNSVTSDNVSHGSLSLRDLSSGARSALTGERGLTGPTGADGPRGPAGAKGAQGEDASTDWAVVNNLGNIFRGTATAVTHNEIGRYGVVFSRSVEACAYSATLARVQLDPGDAPAGRITVAEESGGVRVRTYDLAGVAADIGFHLIVVC